MLIRISNVRRGGERPKRSLLETMKDNALDLPKDNVLNIGPVNAYQLVFVGSIKFWYQNL